MSKLASSFLGKMTVAQLMLKFCKKSIRIFSIFCVAIGYAPQQSLGGTSPHYQSQNITPIKIAALVDGTPIFLHEVKNRVKLMTLGNPTPLDADQQHILEQKALRLLINEFLQLKETERLEITVEPEEIQQYVKHIETQNQWPQGQLKKMLLEAGIPDSTFENHIKANIAWMKLFSQLRTWVHLDESHVEDTLKHISHRKKTKYLLGEIVLYFENMEEEQEYKQLADQIVQELYKGVPFNAMAQQYSMSASAGRGGDIDWVDEDQLDPQIQQALENAPQNTLLPPIKLQDQYVIIALRSKQVVDQEGAEDIYKMREIDIPFPETLPLEAQEKEIQRLETLVKKAKNCEEFSALADSIPGATLQIHEDVSPKVMTPEFQKIAESLQENQISSPIRLNKKGVAFFMLCGKTKGKLDELNSDEIKEMMMNQKIGAIGEKRLRDIRRRAHVEIRL